MQTSIRFAKASGAGNDFVVLNAFARPLGIDYALLARVLCAFHTGIGADGLLVIEPSDVADFRMVYYNSDGSTGGMCGNGGRCIARAAHLAGICGPKTRFDAFGHLYRAEIANESVRLEMKDVVSPGTAKRLELSQGTFECFGVETGAPHAVTFVESVDRIDVPGIGRDIRYHEAFDPSGTNVNFVQTTGTNSLKLRTYERGVEAETLACGTGSVASSVAAVQLRGLKFPVRVSVRSGSTLSVSGRVVEEVVRDVVLEGPAEILFQGEVLIDPADEKILDIGRV